MSSHSSLCAAVLALCCAAAPAQTPADGFVYQDMPTRFGFPLAEANLPAATGPPRSARRSTSMAAPAGSAAW